MEPKQQKFSLGYFIVALIALFVIQSVFFTPHAETVSYSEFKTLVKKGKVSNLVLDKQTIEKEVVDRDGLAQLLAEAQS